MFEQYQHFRAEDFVQDDGFIRWVKKPDAQSDVFWRQFLTDYPERKDEVEQARRIVAALSEATVSEYPAEDAAVIWGGISSRLSSEKSTSGPALRYRTFFRWVAAASVILAIAAFGLWKIRSNVSDASGIVADANAQELTELVNHEDKPKIIALPDGSRVTLLPQGKVRFANQFTGTSREIYLDGTAFFEVTPDASKPFFVYSGTLVTKVLGTSFWVRADRGEKKYVVSVRTGRVSVFANRKGGQHPVSNPDIVLTPNQQAVFDPEKESFAQTLVEKPVLLIRPEQLPEFEFRDAPVSNIFSAIARAYGVSIVFDEKLYASCTLTTSLKTETLFEKLDVICKATASNYKLIENKVVITGKGCE